MGNNQPLEKKKLRKMLTDLIDAIGVQVTRNYVSKNGLWEGLSVNNAVSREACLDDIINLFSQACAEWVREVRKEIEGLETRSEVRKVSDSGFWVKDQLIGRKDALSIPSLKEEE